MDDVNAVVLVFVAARLVVGGLQRTCAYVVMRATSTEESMSDTDGLVAVIWRTAGYGIADDETARRSPCIQSCNIGKDNEKQMRLWCTFTYLVYQ